MFGVEIWNTRVLPFDDAAAPPIWYALTGHVPLHTRGGGREDCARR